jgi:hypothetical protein
VPTSRVGGPSSRAVLHVHGHVASCQAPLSPGRDILHECPRSTRPGCRNRTLASPARGLRPQSTGLTCACQAGGDMGSRVLGQSAAIRAAQRVGRWRGEGRYHGGKAHPPSGAVYLLPSAGPRLSGQESSYRRCRQRTDRHQPKGEAQCALPIVCA